MQRTKCRSTSSGRWARRTLAHVEQQLGVSKSQQIGKLNKRSGAGMLFRRGSRLQGGGRGVMRARVLKVGQGASGMGVGLDNKCGKPLLASGTWSRTPFVGPLPVRAPEACTAMLPLENARKA